MKKIKTHTFRLGRYRIEFTDKLYGLTDIPSAIENKKPVNYTWKDSTKDIIIVLSGGLEELDTCLHEALHAEGIPNNYLHDKNGESTTMRLSRFLWRLGYRKKRKK